MPYCVQCGTQVTDQDQYCGRCGTRQAAAAGQSRPMDIAGGIDGRTAAILCYVPVVGWIASIFVLASSKFRHDNDTRFHAFQGLYLFVAYLLVDWVIGPAMRSSGAYLMGFSFGRLLKFALFCVSIFMVVKVSQREMFKLPILGEWADKSVSEQK